MQPSRSIRPVPRVHALTGKTIAVLSPRPGDTIRAFYARERPKFALPTIVHDCNLSDAVLSRDWDRVITADDRLVLLSSPLGGGGGGGGGGSRGVASIVGLVALVALATVVAGPLGAGLAGSLGLGAAGATAATSAISALIIGGGSYLINHFLGAPRPRKEALEYSLDITSNQARPQQPIPVQYGTVKCFPDVSSPAFSDYLGTQQVFHGLYSISVGYVDLLEIGLNEQPMWTKDGGFAEPFANILQFQLIDPGAQCTLIPTDVATSSDVSGQTLPDPYGTLYADGTRTKGPNGETGGPSEIGPFAANPPGTVADRIAIDLVWPNGLYYTSPNNGGQRATSCRIWCHYRQIDDQGHPVGDWVQAFDTEYTANQKIPYRVSTQIPLPSPMRVQVQIARLDKEGRTGITDSVTWVGLRAYVKGPNTVPYATRLAIQLVADKFISGYSGQQIYVIATRKTNVLVGGQMQLQPNQNPYWAALDVWANADYGGGQSLSNADLATFAALAQEADDRVDTFNYRFTSQSTVLEAIETCLRPALAVPVYAWNRLSAMRDADQRVLPKAMLTDFDIVRGSVGLSYTLKDDQTSDGVILQYIDEATWKSVEVKSTAQDVMLLHPTRMTLPGTTKRQQAIIAARYYAAVNSYRRKTVALETEQTGRLLLRGDLITVSTELALTWGQSAQIASYQVGSRIVGLTVAPSWGSPGQPYMRIARANGAPWGPVFCTEGSDPLHAVINAADAARLASETGLQWFEAMARGDLQERASVEIGFGTPLTFEGLVTRVTPGSTERTLKVELVNDAPQVYAIDTGNVPPLPVPAPFVLPVGPGQIFGINAYVEQDGFSLMLYASWKAEPRSASYTAQISYDDGSNYPYVAYSGELASFMFGPIPPANAGTILLRIRGEATSGIAGPWTVYRVGVPDLSFKPSDIGYVIGYYDITPDVLDAGIVADQAELDAFLGITKAAQGITAAQAKATFDDYTVTQVVVDLEQTVDTSVAKLSASIIQEAGLRVTADDATATVITALNATVQQNAITSAASLLQEATVRASADTSAAAQLLSINTAVGGNTAAIIQESSARTTGDSSIATQIANLSTTVGTNTASISSESATRSAQDYALSQQITTLAASGGSGTANGNLTWAVGATGGDVYARFSLGMTAQATGGGYEYAGLSIEAASGGVSRIVFNASQIVFEDFSTRFVPFGIYGGVNYLQGITKVSNTITSQATASGGAPVLGLDFVNGVLEIYDYS